MILTAEQILAELGDKIEIYPFDVGQLNPNSYNLRLADELLVYKEKVLDMKIKNPYELIHIPEDGLLLMPGRLYLGRTMEKTETRGYVPMIEGRSSVGRLGISIHETAGFGDIGFTGYWTLEISVIQPTIVYAGVEICQIYYHKIDENPETSGIPHCLDYAGKYPRSYISGKYQNNDGIQPSMMWKDFEEKHDRKAYVRNIR